MSKKSKIKPIHLIAIGLAIIVLGILIPSFFINPFSTTGFAVIIGSLILLSAYVFFAINVVKSKGKKTIKWLVLPVMVALLVGGGFFTNDKYQQYLANKLYSIHDKVNLPGFTIEVLTPRYSAPIFKMTNDKIANYGDIGDFENCYKAGGGEILDENLNEDYWATTLLQARELKYCGWRNDSRKKVHSYLENNKKISIDYKITAIAMTVISKDVHVEAVLASGRDVKKREVQFDKDALLSRESSPPFSYEYTPYHQTKLGSDINKGITRNQNISFDLRNGEKIIDIKVTYKGATRLIRINRQ